MHRFPRIGLIAAAPLLVIAVPVGAQTRPAHGPINSLRNLNSSVEALVQRVSPSVVQLLITAYGPRQAADSETPYEIVRELTIGSGVVIDPDGYIVTNAHL